MAASSIGERIRAVRTRVGMTQSAFANVLGYSPRALLNWEQGVAEPSLAVLATIRRLYDVDPEWVMLGEDLIPRRQFGGMDWARLERLEREVDAVCKDVGLGLEAPVRTRLIRGLFDDGVEEDVANKRRLRDTLLAISLGKT